MSDRIEESLELCIALCNNVYECFNGIEDPKGKQGLQDAAYQDKYSQSGVDLPDAFGNLYKLTDGLLNACC